MSGQDREGFLNRWSRLKEEAKSEGAAAPHPGSAAQDEAPQLPPLDELTADSDYRVFFHPKVEESLRRAALKKLFSDPHFNVMDGLDVYIDDYSKTEPLSPGMLEKLEQAQKILAWAREPQTPAAAPPDGRYMSDRSEAIEAADTSVSETVRPGPEAAEDVLLAADDPATDRA